MSNPYFHMYASDWLAGTRSLTAAETGIYITILCMIYEKSGPIDMPRRRLARLCGTTTPALNRALDVLIETGKLDQDGDKLSNARAMVEIEKRADRSQTSRENANARWAKNEAKTTTEPSKRMKSAYANDMQTSCSPEPEPYIKERDTYVSPKKARPAPRKCRISEDAEISEAMVRAADKRGHSQQEAQAQFERFKNDAIAKAKTFANWDRAFVTWLDSPYFKPITTAGGTHGTTRTNTNNRDGEAIERANRVAQIYAQRVASRGH